MTTFLALLGCSTGVLEISPNPVVWGEIDFLGGPPEECDDDEGGCAPTTVTLRNSGDADLEVRANGYDDAYLCVEGFPDGAALELGSLPPGATYPIVLSVCGYEPGDLTSEVSGSIVFEHDGDGSASLDWSFTPVRVFEEDTGP
jgi:hypothetical protein